MIRTQAWRDERSHLVAIRNLIRSFDDHGIFPWQLSEIVTHSSASFRYIGRRSRDLWFIWSHQVRNWFSNHIALFYSLSISAYRAGLAALQANDLLISRASLWFISIYSCQIPSCYILQTVSYSHDEEIVFGGAKTLRSRCQNKSESIVRAPHFTLSISSSPSVSGALLMI
jgi:hypothetical protein